MSNRRTDLATRIICCIAAAISFSMVTAIEVSAMQGPPPPGERSPRGPDRDRELREKILRSAEMKVAIEKKDEKRIEAAIKQVKKDFERIQIVRNEMVRHLLAEKPLDYKFIFEKTGEINERADRLKTFLMPPVPEEKEKSEQSQIELRHEDMKGALVQLCNLMAGFIDNPILKNPDTVDVEQSAKAGGDLIKIIELSGNIKRSAESLRKTQN